MKLKIWDNKKECFVPRGEVIYSFYDEINIKVLPNDISYIGDPMYDNESTLNRFTIIKYAGIKDKNNIELYAGDLREVNGKLYKLVDDGWRFRFERNMVEFGENHDIIVDEDTAYISELRGNIFENKELLN